MDNPTNASQQQGVASDNVKAQEETFIMHGKHKKHRIIRNNEIIS